MKLSSFQKLYLITLGTNLILLDKKKKNYFSAISLPIIDWIIDSLEKSLHNNK